MNEVVVIHGGVAQMKTEGVEVIDLDRVEAEFVCPLCAAEIAREDGWCDICSIRWFSAEYAVIIAAAQRTKVQHYEQESNLPISCRPAREGSPFSGVFGAER